VTEDTNTAHTTRNNYLAEIVEQYLNNGEIVKVSFTKKDGTGRVMLCTRNMAAIPEDKHPKGSGKAKAPHLIVAFDIEKGEWRSFDEESVTTVERGSVLHESK
jgi:predicted RNA-binding protein with RPS1 domain